MFFEKIAAGGTDTVDLDKFNIPKYLLIIKGYSREDILLFVLKNCVGMGMKQCYIKVNEVKTKGEAIILKASKEVVEDTAKMMCDFVNLNGERIDVDIREES